MLRMLDEDQRDTNDNALLLLRRRKSVDNTHGKIQNGGGGTLTMHPLRLKPLLLNLHIRNLRAETFRAAGLFVGARGVVPVLEYLDISLNNGDWGNRINGSGKRKEEEEKHKPSTSFPPPSPLHPLPRAAVQSRHETVLPAHPSRRPGADP